MSRQIKCCKMICCFVWPSLYTTWLVRFNSLTALWLKDRWNIVAFAVSVLLWTHEFTPSCLLQRSAAVKQLQESLKKRAKTSSKEEEELGEGGQEASCASLTETYADLLGYTNPYIYDQLELTTTERRINQIYLLQVGAKVKNSWYVWAALS